MRSYVYDKKHSVIAWKSKDKNRLMDYAANPENFVFVDADSASDAAQKLGVAHLISKTPAGFPHGKPQ